jgi:hypothetical protein
MEDNEDNRTMYDLVKNALQVQDAVNLSGIIHSFSRDISRLRILLELAYKEGGSPTRFSTDLLNRHPICIMWSSKIADLTGSEVGLRFNRAYDWCKNVKGEDGRAHV